MKILETSARIILGGLFLIFGLNHFFPLVPSPTTTPEGSAFLVALANTGYLLHVEKGVEVFAGILLLVNIWAPFAVVLLAPLVVNIFLFHAYLDPSGVLMGSLVLVAEAVLINAYRTYYRPLFARTKRDKDHEARPRLIERGQDEYVENIRPAAGQDHMLYFESLRGL